ncbi:MAG: AbrB/MazE/SpoVT family DNA-binding domain-containing protein [Candidatus Schekmanbacteria bacterium]|nr:AbrB/MazE/SpoVT family DNA-binding domain-containing protein [Candidatus Schekmanbacteria bacterium]
MRVTEKGQVTIPIEIRQQLGIVPETEVEFYVIGNEIRVRKVEGQQRRGRDLISRLRGRGAVKMTTEEIMALTRDEDEPRTS